MRFCVLGSGSKGNATYVASGETALLIDAGFSGKEIERRLQAIGADPADLSAILVTHEHGDHVRGVGVLSRRYKLPVWSNRKTLQAAGNSLQGLHDHQEFATGTSFRLGGLSVHPFLINHDTAEPVGFTVGNDTALFGYCTDTGKVLPTIRHHLSRCNGLVLECNHDLEMLRNGRYPVSLQQRIRSQKGHLANPEAMAFLKELVHGGLEHVVLAHISESNNRPELVRQTVDQLLAEMRETGSNGHDFRISLAAQESAGELITLRA